MLFLIGVFVCSNFPLLAFSDDNLELLSTSLRRLQKSGCHELSLSCPQGTSIALVSAKYSEDIFCPGVQNNVDCQLSNLVQYSLLQTAVERCQKKRHCKLTPLASYGSDPCPGLAKHLVITYSCRPYEFRSKTACENEVVQLQCGPNSRIAIYSASYGRTQYESIQCPQPQGVPEETCLASYATETVIDLCHGKRRCTLSVDSGTFGTPCKKESRMYLKVVYTCVPRRVLLPSYEQGQEEDEVQEPVEEWMDYEEEEQVAPNTIGQHNMSNIVANESVTLHHNRGGSIPTSTAEEEERSGGKVRRDGRKDGTDELINCTLTVYAVEEKSQIVGFISQWMYLYYYLSNNKERLTLYLAVSIGGGLICLLVILVARMACSRRNKKPSVPSSLPSFVGDLYEGETDLSIANPLPLDPNEVVRYSAMNMPRSLAAGNTQYYYG